jgi:short-subunit dehydrogenase
MQSIAVTHARAGAKGLVLVARSIAGLEKTKETVLMENPSLNVLCIAADISDETSVAELYSQIKFKFGIADTLINNAGVFSEYANPFA